MNSLYLSGEKSVIVESIEGAAIKIPVSNHLKHETTRKKDV